jgi:hypothetical protein
LPYLNTPIGYFKNLISRDSKNDDKTYQEAEESLLDNKPDSRTPLLNQATHTVE